MRWDIVRRVTRNMYSNNTKTNYGGNIVYLNDS